MKTIAEDISAFLFFWCLNIYLELILILFGGIDFSAKIFFYILTLSLPFAFFPYVLSSIIRSEKVNFILRIVFSALFSLFYSIEFFSRAFFQNYMSIASILAGSKGIVTDFMGDTLRFVGKKIYILLLLFLPVFALIALTKAKVIKNHRVHPAAALLSAGITLTLFSGSVIAVNNIARDNEKYSSHYEFDTAAGTFGLNTALRLDAAHLMFDKAEAPDFYFEEAAALDTSDTSDTADISGSAVSSGSEEDTVSGNTPGTPPSEQDKDTGAPDASETETLTEPEPEPEPEPIMYGTHSLDLDFAAMAETETNKTISSLHKYVASMTPSSENEYTGLLEGKNLIFISAEAFSRELLNEELNPTLYRMFTKGINFTDYYQPVWGGSTSTGEYSNMTGLIPAYGIASMQHTIGKNMHYTLGNRLKSMGYFSRAYHAHYASYYDRDQTHENLGYEKFIARGTGLDESVKFQWPESDLELMQATVDDYINEPHFSIYYMSVSGHTRYNWQGNAMSGKNRDAVSELDVPEPIKAYYACNLELEYAMEYLIGRLEEAGIADDTVIVMAADHYPFGLEDEPSDTYKNALGDLYGYDYTDQFERDHNRLIIWSECLEDMEPIIVDEPTYSLDIVPTVSNLLGLDFDSRLYVGRDVFSDAEPLLIWPNYSWMTDKAVFNSGKNQITIREGFEDEVTDEYISSVAARVSNYFTFSKNAVDYDYYNVLYNISNKE